MTKQTVVGGGLILAALLMFLSGLGDRIADLQDWHGLATTDVVGHLLKDAAQIGLGIVGGTLLPGVGSASKNTETLTVDITKVGKL